MATRRSRRSCSSTRATTSTSRRAACQIQDPDATSTIGAGDGGTLLGQALTTRAFGSDTGTLAPQTLIVKGATLLGSSSVSQFSVGGTHMRRTGLNQGSGVGSGCTIGSGQAGVCAKTSTCAAQGKVSTQNFCPGPYNVQCCTANAASSSTGGDTGGSDGSSTPSTSDGSLVQNGLVALAELWVSAQMPYCQAVNGGP